MPVFLRDIKKELQADRYKKGRKDDGSFKFTPPNIVSRQLKDYTDLKVLSFEQAIRQGIKAIDYRAIVKSEAGIQNKKTGAALKYSVTVRFLQIPFSNEMTPTTDILVSDQGGDIIYHALPHIRENPVMLKCSCFTGDTLVSLPEGKSVQIKDLVGRKEFSVYSFDTIKKEYVIGLGYNCEIKEKSADIFEVTLDNGHKIKCTGDHKFLNKNGDWIRADELSNGVSLEAMYRKHSTESEGKVKRNGYEQILQRTGWVFTHVLADTFNLINKIYEKAAGTIRHHVDFNKLNNCPSNIKRMSWYDHNKIHHSRMLGDLNPMKSKEVSSKVVKSNTENGSFIATSHRMKKNNPMQNSDSLDKMLESNQEFKRNIGVGANFKSSSEAVRSKISMSKKGKMTKNHGNLLKLNLERVSAGLHNFQTNEHKDFAKKLLSDKNNQSNMLKGRYVKAIRKCLMQFGIFNSENYKLTKAKTDPKFTSVLARADIESLKLEAANHKVVSVIKTNTKEDVYCFTVKNYGNFVIDVDNGIKLSSGVVAHNCPDFRHRFEHELHGAAALIGAPRKYKRETPIWPLGSPYANSTHKLGVCKHIHSFIQYLRKQKLVRGVM